MNYKSELENNIVANTEKLVELLKTYETAQIGYDLQNEEFKQVYDKVLAENTFVANKEWNRDNNNIIKIGDRITDSDLEFLLSEEDWDKFMKLAKKPLIEANLINEKYEYAVNWLILEVEARKELVDFIVNNIVPSEMRKDFDKIKTNFVYQDKLIEIIKNGIKTTK